MSAYPILPELRREVGNSDGLEVCHLIAMNGLYCAFAPSFGQSLRMKKADWNLGNVTSKPADSRQRRACKDADAPMQIML